MPNLRFFVRTTKKTPAAIRLYFSIARGTIFHAKTPYIVKPEDWDIRSGCIKKSIRYADREAEQLQQRLLDMEKCVYNQFNRCRSPLPKDWLQKTIDRHLNQHTGNKEAFVDYGRRFFNELFCGMRLGLSGHRIAISSVKSLRNCLFKVKEYEQQQGRVLTFNDINIDFYRDFMLFLTCKGYTPNTNANIIKTIKIVMAAAKDEHLHDNNLFRDIAFKAIGSPSDTIYLTKSEVQAIEQLELSTPEEKRLEISRDLFLLGIYTAQRYSDYSQIMKANMDTVNGVNVLRIVQQKTKVAVTLPVSQKLIAILERYGDKAPYRNITLFGQEIKMICRKAGITQIVKHREVKGGETRVVEKRKYELVTSHTARRTGASLMYLNKIDMLSIMKITGHKTEMQFFKYIRVTPDEIAVQLSKLDYFK